MTDSAELLDALAALELAALRHRRLVRQRLRVGDEELAALLFVAQRGAVAQRRLGEVTSLSRSGTGSMVQRLEERGLLQRRTDPRDRRLRLIELSPDGRARLQRAYGELGGAVDRVVGSHTPDQTGALTELVRALADAAWGIGEPGAEPPAATGGGDPIWRQWG